MGFDFIRDGQYRNAMYAPIPNASAPPVVWIINHYALEPGGAGGTRHYTLAKHLAEIGWKPLILAASTEMNTNRQRLADGESSRGEAHGAVGFLWLRAPTYRGNGIGRLLNMLTFAAKIALFRCHRHPGLTPPDVILGSSPHLFAALAAWVLARRYRVPFVLEIRDLWPESLIELLRLSPRHPLVITLRLMADFLYRRADHIVTVLPGAAALFAARGAKPEGITVIPNGVDVPPSLPPLAPSNNERFTVLYAGAHGVPNFLDTLLEAAELLQQSGTTPVHILMVGDGVCKQALMDEAKNRGLRNVTFRPPVPKHEVAALLASADACYLQFRDAALYRFGVSPNKLFDYLLAGKPLLYGASFPDNPLTEAGVGYIVPSGDAAALAGAIERLAALPEAERTAMGERARAYALAHHDMRALAARLDTVLRSCVSGPR